MFKHVHEFFHTCLVIAEKWRVCIFLKLGDCAVKTTESLVLIGILWPSRHRLSHSRDFESCRTTGQTWCHRHTHTKHCSIAAYPVFLHWRQYTNIGCCAALRKRFQWNYYRSTKTYVLKLFISIWKLSIIHRQSRHRSSWSLLPGLCRFSVWILVFLVLVSNCISVMRNQTSLKCQASAYQFLGLLLVSWIKVINGTNKWDEDR